MTTFLRRARARVGPIVLGIVVFASHGAEAAHGQDATAAVRAESRTELRPAGGTETAATIVVTPLEIFQACRHADAFKESPLQEFCELRLPARRAGISRAASEWGREFLTPGEIREYSDQVQRRQRDLQRAAAPAAAVRLGPDISERVIVFVPGDKVLAEAQRDALQTLIANRVLQMMEQSDVQGVQVIGFGDTGDNHRSLGAARAEVVAGLLKQRGVSAQALAADLRPGEEAWGTVQVRPVLRLITATEIPPLQAVRFSPGQAEIDAGNAYLLDAAAASILASPEYQRGAFVEVVGHPDVAGKDSLATGRASALREALAQRGVERTRIETRHARQPRDAALPAGTPPVRQSLMTITGEAASAAPAPAPAAVPGAAAPFAMSWEALAQAAAGAIVEVAEKQMQEYVMVTFSRRVCERSRGMLEGTCLVLRDPGSGRYIPSLSTIRLLLRQDAEQFPDRTIAALLNGQYADPAPADRMARARNLDRLASHLAELASAPGGDPGGEVTRALTKAQQDIATLPKDVQEYLARERRIRPVVANATMALYAFDFARRMHRGEDPVEVLSGFSEWMIAYKQRFPALGYVEFARPVEAMRQFSGLLRSTLESAEQLQRVTAGVTPQDTVLRYAALTLLANRDAALTHGWATRLASLLEARRQVDGAISALDEIRRRLSNLQAYGTITGDQRRELYGLALQQMVKLSATGFMSTHEAGQREEITEWVETLSSLVTAIRSESYPQLLQQSLVVLRNLVPRADSLCFSGSNCSSAFATEQLRVLTLAVDVSEARSEADLQSAMARFAGGGGGFTAKRAVPVQSSLQLNSYVGAGWAARDGAAPGMVLRLPIGIELVPRWPRLLGLSMLSLHAQVLDLGGFLPQPSDSVDRSTDQRLASVFAPGLFVMGGLGDIPASIGAGVTSASEVKNDRWKTHPRLVVFLGVDVPLLKIR